MNYDDFTGEVQHRIDTGTKGETVRATRAVLTTLGERLQEGEATDLAGPLPMEIDYYLESADHGQRFDFDEFVSRVAERERMDPDSDDDRPDAAFHAKAVTSLVADVVPESELEQVRDQLPDDEDWDELFELVGADDAAFEDGR
ncbi:DUF2267 domain-containing protein [Halorussus sp. MSC15.2]|uniref:DUF2267 domain-containing protein n=1 Tax=Halorussus sp. MSC15.2 TaxID=2283638 RepID=UPI0013D71F7F|nr:DUF2267 domain-containing protein [Halorussus sp. MSC15.2]NEU56830.1 DUF2267 domain-containing protein [Halorussus sp. MSC15.2]